jgi:hypothetical protein
MDQLKFVQTAPPGFVVASDNNLLLEPTLEDDEGLLRIEIAVTCCTAFEEVSTASKRAAFVDLREELTSARGFRPRTRSHKNSHSPESIRLWRRKRAGCGN